jgi:zinc finger protein
MTDSAPSSSPPAVTEVASVLPSTEATPSFTTIPRPPPSNFPPIDADSDLDRLTSLSSLCMNCHEEGETRLLLTSIPYFRDVIIMSFSCPHCHFTSSEVQPASEIQSHARRFILHVDPSDESSTHRDLNRQLIKSESAVVRIPEVDFEIGATGVRGDINTIEGVLGNVCDSLEVGQANRALADVDVWRKVAALIEEVRRMKEGQRPFTFIIDDLAGNSYIENPYAPAPDPRVKLETYTRTPEQTEALGYAQEGQPGSGDEQKADVRPAGTTGKVSVGGVEVLEGRYAVAAEVQDRVDTFFNVSDRSAVLQGQCTGCQRECETRMAVTDIPHFKEVVLMSTNCEW